MLGTLNLPLRKNRNFLVVGGPYVDRIPGTVGVKMAKEINKSCDINIPTPDFQTPNPGDLANGLAAAVERMIIGEQLYVGCYAGKGRTGLFMAVLARAMGIENPVEYVRKHYYAHAVETSEQYDFVMNFPIPKEVTKALFWARFRSYFSSKKNLTNGPVSA